MNTTTFDTLTAARSLEGAGIEPKQAEAIVAAIRSSRSEIITKGDLSTAVAKLQASTKDDIAELKRDIAVLRFAVFPPRRRFCAYSGHPIQVVKEQVVGATIL